MARPVPLVFKAEVLADRQPPPVSVLCEGRCIEIIGGLSVTESAGQLDGSASRYYRTLTLRVVWRPDPLGELQGVTDFAYRARLLDLEPGRYLLRVRHTVLLRGSGGESVSTGLTLLEQEIRIPKPDKLGPEDHAGMARIVNRDGTGPGAGED
jgi:hypothetical protein